MNKKKQKVFVAMSGGVDSSVAAALVKKRGFDVVGVYMKCWLEGPSCTTEEDERSARLAASHLAIPFYVWNFIPEYKEKVVDYMIQGYAAGVTPNPDMMCNREIKFGLFFDKAMKLGADFIATGHYARIVKKEGVNRILKGKDSGKDQSYFLAFVKQEVLDRVFFPIGRYTKIQVRQMARDFKLPNAERKESQGICFVGKVDIGDFLREYIPAKQGEIVSTSGEVLGTHDGSFYYTIGQRQGLKLPGGPYYVAKKNIESNTLIVSREEKDVLESEVTVNNVNWFGSSENTMSIGVKLRYRQEDVPAILSKTGKNSCVLRLSTPQRSITPGQFAVFYQGDELIGGGQIV